MSESRRKKQVTFSFESAGNYTDANGTLRSDTSARIFESMLVSKSFKTLTEKQKVLYLYIKAQLYGKRKPSADFKDEGLYQSDDCFYFSLKMAKQYGLYTDKTHGNFYRDMKELINHGLIEKISSGRNSKTKSVYRYSDKWKEYESK